MTINSNEFHCEGGHDDILEFVLSPRQMFSKEDLIVENPTLANFNFNKSQRARCQTLVVPQDVHSRCL